MKNEVLKLQKDLKNAYSRHLEAIRKMSKTKVNYDDVKFVWDLRFNMSVADGSNPGKNDQSRRGWFSENQEELDKELHVAEQDLTQARLDLEISSTVLESLRANLRIYELLIRLPDDVEITEEVTSES